jgi:hypothetical protein
MNKMSARKAKIKAAPPARTHEPQAGRRAFLCDHRDQAGNLDCALRRFMGPGVAVPECPQHGKMQIQQNRPYLGQEIP